MTRLCARCTCDEAVSSIVAMILILAMLAVAVPLAISNFVPHYIKNVEIQRYEESEASFLRIAEAYPDPVKLRLYMGRQTPFGFVAATSFGAKSSGRISIEAVCDSGSVGLSCDIPSLYLYLPGRSVPNRTLIFSEGGIVVEQHSREVIVSSPNITLVYNSSLTVVVDCLESEKKISGSGIIVVDVGVQREIKSYKNCTGKIYVNDTIFQDYWNDAMRSTSLPVSGSTLSFDSLNLTLIVRRVGIKV
ncbi:hypothetical protein [Archaeoglobus neptunius]|uniref:hypothetical protein n=1 Tax=Archaeoglobus neptunius TaxID=2798580 RepID=UPI00192846AE|nr:hypothetical protein [Archaeoglobus neptunius]